MSSIMRSRQWPLQVTTQLSPLTKLSVPELLELVFFTVIDTNSEISHLPRPAQTWKRKRKQLTGKQATIRQQTSSTNQQELWDWLLWKSVYFLLQKQGANLGTQQGGVLIPPQKNLLALECFPERGVGHPIDQTRTKTEPSRIHSSWD